MMRSYIVIAWVSFFSFLNIFLGTWSPGIAEGSLAPLRNSTSTSLRAFKPVVTNPKGNVSQHPSRAPTASLPSSRASSAASSGRSTPATLDSPPPSPHGRRKSLASLEPEETSVLDEVSPQQMELSPTIAAKLRNSGWNKSKEVAPKRIQDTLIERLRQRTKREYYLRNSEQIPVPEWLDRTKVAISVREVFAYPGLKRRALMSHLYDKTRPISFQHGLYGFIELKNPEQLIQHFGDNPIYYGRLGTPYKVLTYEGADGFKRIRAGGKGEISIFDHTAYEAGGPRGFHILWDQLNQNAELKKEFYRFSVGAEEVTRAMYKPNDLRHATDEVAESLTSAWDHIHANDIDEIKAYLKANHVSFNDEQFEAALNEIAEQVRLFGDRETRNQASGLTQMFNGIRYDGKGGDAGGAHCMTCVNEDATIYAKIKDIRPVTTQEIWFLPWTHDGRFFEDSINPLFAKVVSQNEVQNHLARANGAVKAAETALKRIATFLGDESTLHPKVSNLQGLLSAMRVDLVGFANQSYVHKQASLSNYAALSLEFRDKWRSFEKDLSTVSIDFPTSKNAEVVFNKVGKHNSWYQFGLGSRPIYDGLIQRAAKKLAQREKAIKKAKKAAQKRLKRKQKQAVSRRKKQQEHLDSEFDDEEWAPPRAYEQGHKEVEPPSIEG